MPFVDWQFQADLRDRDITDTLSYAGHIHIALPSRLSLSVLILDDRRPELFVILSRRFFGCIDLFLIHLLHCIIIRFHYLCGIALVEYIADDRVSRDADACHKHKNGKYGLQFLHISAVLSRLLSEALSPDPLIPPICARLAKQWIPAESLIGGTCDAHLSYE